jgi:heat shock protein HtpX
MTLKTFSFSMQTEVAPAYINDLLLFIYREYLVPLYRNFINIRRWTINGRDVLAFTAVDSRGFWHVDVEVTMGNPLEVKMTPYGNVPEKVLTRIKEDLIIVVQMFEDKIRRTTLYFAWVPEKKIIPEKTVDRRRKVLSKIFFGNMLVFYAIFILLSYTLFLVSTEIFKVPPEYYPLILVALQFVMVLFSDKIVGTLGDWPITALSPYVHILQYHLSPEQFATVQQNYGKETFLQIKREIYDETLAVGKPITCEVAQKVFHKYGIEIDPESLVVKTVNAYNLVKEAAVRFKLPIPKIKLWNVIVPNAAATGPTPRFGLVLLTTGLLVQLDEEEIFAVVGHELSHVKRRDPVALALLVTAEYLLRVYYFWAFLYYFGFFYIFLSFGVLYFIAKFFEARADLESALQLGRPDVLANALRKIGYRRIQMERMQQSWLGAWFGWNPHPPISFRIERLESLREPEKIKHPFLQSIKDCIKGLIADLQRL